jgi:hypothetical protein
MPCTSCNSEENLEIVKHVRKRAYTLIPAKDTMAQVTQLRGRNLLCKFCHMSLVHAGRYNGRPLILLATNPKLYDNRIVHIDQFIRPRSPKQLAKTIEGKGQRVNVDLQTVIRKYGKPATDVPTDTKTKRKRRHERTYYLKRRKGTIRIDSEDNAG